VAKFTLFAPQQTLDSAAADAAASTASDTALRSTTPAPATMPSVAAPPAAARGGGKLAPTAAATLLSARTLQQTLRTQDEFELEHYYSTVKQHLDASEAEMYYPTFTPRPPRAGADVAAGAGAAAATGEDANSVAARVGAFRAAHAVATAAAVVESVDGAVTLGAAPTSTAAPVRRAAPERVHDYLRRMHAKPAEAASDRGRGRKLQLVEYHSLEERLAQMLQDSERTGTAELAPAVSRS
jgi:hypothetical protein